jgi:hypothetical protein
MISSSRKQDDVIYIELTSRSLTVGKSLSPVDFPSAPGWLELLAPWVGLPELLSRYWEQSNFWTRACITGLLLMAFATFFFSHRPQSFMRVEGIHMTGCCPVPQRDCLQCCHHHLSAMQPLARFFTPTLLWARALFAVLRYFPRPWRGHLGLDFGGLLSKEDLVKGTFSPIRKLLMKLEHEYRDTHSETSFYT